MLNPHASFCFFHNQPPFRMWILTSESRSICLPFVVQRGSLILGTFIVHRSQPMETKPSNPAFVSAAGIPSTNAFAGLLAPQTKARAMKHIFAICTILLIAVPRSFAQSFVNLDFEEATVAPAPPGYTPSDAFNPISAASALPGWTVREDGIICTAVWGTPSALDETSVALVSAGNGPIQGNYSVQLSAYANAPPGYYHNSSISQTGLIPGGTQSIQFLIANPFQAGIVQPNPIVSLNGTPISLSEISQSGGVITMVGDVSAFAGTTADLTVLCEATPGPVFPANENIFNLDNIQFSVSPVPEPETLALFATGAFLLALHRRRSSMA
jgi:hypothetical protein